MQNEQCSEVSLRRNEFEGHIQTEKSEGEQCSEVSLRKSDFEGHIQSMTDKHNRYTRRVYMCPTRLANWMIQLAHPRNKQLWYFTQKQLWYFDDQSVDKFPASRVIQSSRHTPNLDYDDRTTGINLRNNMNSCN